MSLSWRWEMPVTSLPVAGSLLKETPTRSSQHLLPQPSKADRRPHGTSLQIKPWGQDGHHLHGASLFPWSVVRPQSVSPSCLDRQIRPVGSSGWTTCKCSKERLFEEPVRRSMRVRGRKGEECRNEQQLGATSKEEELLWLRTASCFHSQETEVCFPTFGLFSSIIQEHKLLLVEVGASLCNQIQS